MRILLYLKHFFVFSLYRFHQVLSDFILLQPPPTNLWMSLTNIVQFWVVMQSFFCSEYLLKHLVPELWNVDKSTLTWLSYFLSCVFFNTYFSPVYQRQMATTFWYTAYLPSHVVCFWTIFFTLSIKWADSSLIHLFLLLTSCIFRNLTSALSKW